MKMDKGDKKEADAAQWIEQSMPAFQCWNDYVARNGLPLAALHAGGEKDTDETNKGEGMQLDEIRRDLAKVVDPKGRFLGTDVPVSDFLRRFALLDDSSLWDFLDEYPKVTRFQAVEVLRLSNALILAVVSQPFGGASEPNIE
jgi:hypothetical protein